MGHTTFAASLTAPVVALMPAALQVQHTAELMDIAIDKLFLITAFLRQNSMYTPQANCVTSN